MLGCVHAGLPPWRHEEPCPGRGPKKALRTVVRCMQGGQRIGAETEVGGTRDGEGGEEVGGPEQEQKEEVTLEDVCRLAVELSEINNQRSCEISELLNDTKNLLNSWTANQTSDDEEDDGEQGDDESDLLVLFDSLGKRLKTFQRDLASTDKKVENAKKTSSPLRKRRRKRR